MSTEEMQSKVQPEVELDLDDVKEEQVELKQEPETKKEEAPSLNVGEVDLGYTSHDKEQKEEKPVIEEVQEEQTEVKQEASETETETKAEEKKDNLQEVSDSVQKRIDKLTRRYREAERREKAALDYAKSLQKKYSGYDKKVDTADENYLKEFDARVDAQREQVKFNLKAAIEANDPDAIMKANDELTRLSVEKEKARLQMEDRQARAKQAEEEAKANEGKAEQIPGYEQQQVQQPEPSDKALAWKEKNTWFGKDKVMTNAAFTIHDDLVAMGIDVESDEYYNEVDKRMKDNFPHKFAASEEKPAQPKPVQKVASAGRTQEGRRTVKLTKSQVAIAKKLGVPLEEYAKFVKEGN